MNVTVLSLGSAGFRTILRAAPKFLNTTVMGIDTCMDESFRDARRQGYTIKEDGGMITMEKEPKTTVGLHICGKGQGGGMDWQQGRKVINAELKEGSPLMRKLHVLNSSHICMLVAFAGNATGTNIPLLLSKIVPMYPRCVFIPVIGMPLRTQPTEMDIAMNVTLKEMLKRRTLPAPVLVDNAAFRSFDDFERIDRELAAAIRGLVDVMTNSEIFSFDIGDLLRTLKDRDFAILGHTRLKGDGGTGDLMDKVLALVDIEQQFSQPDNKAQYGVIALKVHHSDGDLKSKNLYDLVSQWGGNRLVHCKTTPWLVRDGAPFDPEVTVLMGGYPLSAVRPRFPEVNW